MDILVAPSLDWAPQHIRKALAGDEVFAVPTVAEVELHPDVPKDLRNYKNISDLLRAAEGDNGEKLLRAPNREEAHLRIIASTNGLVRDNGIVPTEAWENHMDVWLTNPVVAFAHMPMFGEAETRMPIGRAVDTRLSVNRGVLEEWWLFNDVTDVSRQVHALYVLGDMKAASVGFIIHEFHRLDEKERKRLSRKFPKVNEFTWMVDEAELVETSAVAVGSDPRALAAGKARSLFQGADFAALAVTEPPVPADDPPASGAIAGLASFIPTWAPQDVVTVDPWSRQFALAVVHAEADLGLELDAVRRQFIRVMTVPTTPATIENVTEELVDLIRLVETMLRSKDMPVYEAVARAAGLYWDFQRKHADRLVGNGQEELITRAYNVIRSERQMIEIVTSPLIEVRPSSGE